MTISVVAFGVVACVVLGVVVVVLALRPWVLPRRVVPVRSRRVLAIGAHPDDVELGCGGALAKFVDAGHEVRALVLSNGERGGAGATRVSEVDAAGRRIGIAGVTVLSFPDTDLPAHADALVAAIERVMERFNPDIILTHSGNDQHQDHRAVHLATLRAGRRHTSILCYESPSATADFRPSVFVDVQDYLEVKVRAVAAHRDQAGKPYMSGERLRGLAVFRGAQAKVRHAEGYEPVRMLDDSLDHSAGQR
ncbi:PIG-L deacetylase family protein [Actinophytocola algeriensis]|uniref:LmbE family N-acetylglucosaminyl deacetylase n=1 Tax=Actinophytocola algeriensis TaxID=1768010 RepID=A0A7W7Q1A0_9PSEU|nr:PIG-L deacetylase family protein [Actinophytocola algeriensis]MBB4905147.1 LmbE family N-acetylglucosaminyl deacetylase [Actinophytocola algeriensis]MBE1473168.1 LmbE family N-acetylglucosaminyl deacetylase [Actinophytocola algeriensis]